MKISTDTYAAKNDALLQLDNLIPTGLSQNQDSFYPLIRWINKSSANLKFCLISKN
ncbi:hypothetical protein ACH3O9_06025 [Leeuwenhoekiella sp. A16]|uniref:hypothetical protein n=1 Tax=unclassified Leeuwenhoekiella TaxID=2615029 RepID=UPI003A80A5AC